MSSPTDVEEDVHGIVLKEAFDDLNRRNANKIILRTADHREAILNGDLLVLFSEFFRDLLSSVPKYNDGSPCVILPDVSVGAVHRLQDILSQGFCQDIIRVEETKELLESFQLLGVNIKNIHYERIQAGSEGSEDEVCLNLSNYEGEAGKVREIVGQKMKEGKRILFSNTPDPVQEEQPDTSLGNTFNMQNVPIKMEINTEPAREDTVMEETGEGVTKTGESSTEHVEKDEGLGSTKPARGGEIKNEVSNPELECEKCGRPHSDLVSLKKHLASHFRVDLKEKYSQSWNKETKKCHLCDKPMTNKEVFLLHVALHHDKLNEVLKMKGMKELPSSRKVPYVQSRSATSAATRTKSTTPSASSSGSPSPTLAPPQTPVQSGRGPQVAATPASERKPLDSECNFDLTCQVCSQRQGSQSKLEQHLCRHFMKELQESFGKLMNDMKCNLCNNVFKHKQSLLLHIGCKHGKINDILRQRKMKVLPAQVLNNPSMAMQKKLEVVKRERVESSKGEETLSELSGGSLPTNDLMAKYNNVQDVLDKYKIKPKFGSK